VGTGYGAEVEGGEGFLGECDGEFGGVVGREEFEDDGVEGAEAKWECGEVGELD
jgi:hypothetical protein